MLIGCLETFFCVWADVNASKDRLRILRKLYWNNYFGIVSVNIIDAMDQSLIQVKDDSFCFVWCIWLWEVRK